MKQSGKKTALAAMGLCAALMLTGCGKSDAAKYEDAQKLVREGAYDEAITAFTEIDGYEDSSKYLMYIKAIQMAENGQRDLAVSTLTTLGDFADSKMLAIYYQAQEDEAKQEYESADALYRTIATFKDSAERIAAIPDLILDRDFANSKIQVEWDGDCSAMIALLGKTYSADENKMKQQIYDYAQERLELKEYDEAYELFRALAWRGYSDSVVRMKDVVYAYAQDEMSQGEYQTALDMLRQLTDYPAAEEPIRECRYQLAMQAEADGQYAKAYAEYADLGEYKDCADKAARFENEYAAASALLAGGEYDNAKSAFEALKDYADAEKMAKESVYQKGKKQLADGRFDEAKATFESLEDYADAQTMVKESVYQKGKKQLADEQYDLALSTFSALGTYKKAYDDASYAQSRIDMQKGDYQKALDGLVKLMGYGYQEAEEPILECRYQLAAQAEKNGQYAQAYAEYIDLGEYKDCADRAAKFENNYATAQNLLDAGDYDQAEACFEALKDYADASTMAQESVYQKGEKQLADGQYDLALSTFSALGTYKKAYDNAGYAQSRIDMQKGDYQKALDRLVKLMRYGYQEAEEPILECRYQLAAQAEKNGQYAQAYAEYIDLGEYKDCADRAAKFENDYATAQNLLNAGDYDQAEACFEALKDYADASTMAQEAAYQKGKKQLADGQFDEAKATFESLKDYSDAETMVKESVYQKGEKLLVVGDYDGATAAYQAAGDYSDASTKAKEAQYRKGESLLATGDYDGAIAAYRAASSYSDAVTKVKEAQYQKGEAMMAAGDYDGAASYYLSIKENSWAQEAQYQKGESLLANHNERAAVQTFEAITGYQDALKRSYQIRYQDLSEGKIAAGGWHTAGLKSDGTVVATGYNDYGQCDVSGWRDIVAVSTGSLHTVGLKSDGTVVAMGYNDYGRCDVSGWRDIVAVSAGGRHTVGLKSDGTVVVTGDNEYGQCDVSGWTDIGGSLTLQ